jgi:hypothetical protein
MIVQQIERRRRRTLRLDQDLGREHRTDRDRSRQWIGRPAAPLERLTLGERSASAGRSTHRKQRNK